MSITYWQHSMPSLTFGCALCKVLPKRIKRLVMLSCLLGYVSTDKFSESVVMERLNNAFELTDNCEALRLPTRLAILVRERITRHQIFIPHQRGPLYRMAVDIVSNTPPGLRYASLTEMREDVLRVLRMAL